MCLTQVVWSYSMADHFKDKHSRVQMPPDLLKAVQLDFHEKALVMHWSWLMQLLNKYKATKVCKGKNCECKETV